LGAPGPIELAAAGNAVCLRVFDRSAGRVPCGGEGRQRGLSHSRGVGV